MGKHLGKREREARKRNKRRTEYFAWQHAGQSGSLTLKLGTRKRKKVNLQKLSGLPF